MHASNRNALSGNFLIAAMLFLLLAAFWFVYAGPALKKHRTEQEILELSRFLRGNPCTSRLNPHWLNLKLQRPENLYLQVLTDPLRIKLQRWQESGGIPSIDVTVDLAKLSPAERREFYQRIHRLEVVYLTVFGVTDADVEAILAIPVSHYLSVFAQTGLSAASLRSLGTSAKLQYLGLRDPAMTADKMKEIGRMVSLTSLSLPGSAISDADLKELRGLSELEQLDLDNTTASDAGIQELASCGKLCFLTLSNTAITDAGLKEIGKFSLLGGLINLSGTKVTDNGIKELTGLSTLWYLYLSGTAVTDDAMKSISRLKELRQLTLSETRVTNAGMKELAGLPTLDDLDLSKTAVDDAGILELAGMKSLNWLTVGPKVTADGIKAFNDRRVKSGIGPSDIKIVP